MRKYILFGLFSLVSIPSYAQVNFSQSDVISNAQAQTFEFKLYQTLPGQTTPTTFVLTGVTCTGAAPIVNCTSPKPATLNTATGVKFELTSRDVVNNTAESARSLPFFLSSAAPTILTIIR